MTTETLDRDIEQLAEAMQLLAEDVQAAASLSEMRDTGFGRRAYIRAAFALIEGNVNLMAHVVLGALGRKEVHLLPKEIEILRQERRTSDEDGVPIVRVMFVPICARTAPVI